MSNINSLSFLLTASNKNIINKCFNVVFTSRLDDKKYGIKTLIDILNLESEEDGNNLYKCMLDIILLSLSCNDISTELVHFFKENDVNNEINSKLKELILAIVDNNHQTWIEASAFNRVSLPKLINVDWTLHLKKASSQVTNMNVPSIILEMQLEEQVLFFLFILII